MEMILELLLAAVLSALGLGGFVQTKLKAKLGVGILEFIKDFELPKPEVTEELYVPSLADYLDNMGQTGEVEEAEFEAIVKKYDGKLLNPVGKEGKPAILRQYLLSNETVAYAVRWPAGNYYFIDKDLIQ